MLAKGDTMRDLIKFIGVYYVFAWESVGMRNKLEANQRRRHMIHTPQLEVCF